MTTHITKRALACSLLGGMGAGRTSDFDLQIEAMVPASSLSLCGRPVWFMEKYAWRHVEDGDPFPADLCDECRVIWDGAHERGEMPEDK